MGSDPIQLLRFNGGVTSSPAVEDWFAGRSSTLGLMAHDWFIDMKGCGDDVIELLHDGFPVALVGDLPFAYVNVFTAHLNVGFFLGAELHDPEDLLLGTGIRMRHVKVRPEGDHNEKALAELIRTAYADIKGRI